MIARGTRSCVVMAILIARITLAAAAGIHGASVSEFNVVWDSPSTNHDGSMPIGNGETGMNLWVEPDGDLVFLISRTDSWDENERLCKLGRVRIQFDPGLAGPAFRQELKLHSGEIEILGGTGDEAIRIRAWVDANRQVIHLDADSRQAFGIRAALEVWRTESKAPGEPAKDDPFLGLKERRLCADTVVGGQSDRVAWYHRNTTSPWAATLKLQGLERALEGGSDPLLHRTFGGVMKGEWLVRETDRVLKSVSPRKQFRLAVHTHTETPATESQWLAAVEKTIAEAEAVDPGEALCAHRQWWSDFWNRSWIVATSRDVPARGITSLVPSNAHEMHVGMDSRGGNRLLGDVSRISVIGRVLTPDEIVKLAGMPTKRLEAVKDDVRFSANPIMHSGLPDSARWMDVPALTVEAWFKPAAAAGSGRILDKGTPGVNDGFLLDTHPGNSLRLLVGNRNLSVRDCLRAEAWHHVAVTLDSKRDRVELFLNGARIAEDGTGEDFDDAYVVTRGYILQRWINACGGRGNFPIKFNGSIFTVDGGEGERKDPDYRRWGGCYWFQNTRLPYWPMMASGDHDLMQPLFRMFLDIMPLAKIRTQVYFNHEGAFFPETMSFWGTYHNGNWGWGWRAIGKPGAPTVNRYIRYHYSGTLELLAMMIDFYHYTESETFLTQTLLPVADEYLLWWDRHWSRDDRGKLHMSPSSSCETYWECTNPSPDIAGLMWNLDQLLSLSDGEIGVERRACWEKLRKAIPPMPRMERDGRTIIAPAELPLPDRTNVENPELYTIFPFRLYGVGKPGLGLARDTFEYRIIQRSWGWAQDDTQAAYLGLADQAAELVARRANARFNEPGNKKEIPTSRFPAFWGPNHDWVPDQDHGGNLLMGLQTMIVQADEGRIHLLPAWPDRWDLDFKLHAPRNTTVQGIVRGGKLIDLEVTPKSRERDVMVRVPR